MSKENVTTNNVVYGQNIGPLRFKRPLFKRPFKKTTTNKNGLHGYNTDYIIDENPELLEDKQYEL